MTTPVRIGKIVGFHGLRGDVKIHPVSDAPEWAGVLDQVTLQNPKKPSEQITLQLAESKVQGPLVLARFKDRPDRTSVESLMGWELYTRQSELPPPEENEFWANDLIGLTVLDHDTRRKRGQVKDLLTASGSDFLEIQLDESDETVVIPFINHFFPEVNVEQGHLTVTLLDDLLQPVTHESMPQ